MEREDQITRNRAKVDVATLTTALWVNRMGRWAAF